MFSVESEDVALILERRTEGWEGERGGRGERAGVRGGEEWVEEDGEVDRWH